MLDHTLNIIGSEWVIIIFVAIVLIFGTNQLPGAARKMGKVVGEYNKAKSQMENQMKEISNHNLQINGPVQNERQKLEMIAKSLGMNTVGKSDDDLRNMISGEIGQKSESGAESISKD